MKEKLNIRKMTLIGMLGAIAVVLMLFEIPLPFAPSFYEIDLSEVPVLIGCFAMGPLAGVLIELIKILLNLLINGSVTAGVGELANFVIGCSFILPAGWIYKKNHTKKGALLGLVTGTFVMTTLGCFINAYVMLPAYAAAFGMPIEKLIAMGTAVNGYIDSLLTFVFFAVVPFNLLKGVLVSVIVFCIYKKIRPILKVQR
ncbi:MAG: ECF transporter S component [Faecalimonas sp.]|nr:ECF transporter S component [Faecalimonas sp.]